MLFGSKSEVIFAYHDGGLQTHDRVRLAILTSAGNRFTEMPTKRSSTRRWAALCSAKSAGRTGFPNRVIGKSHSVI